MALNGGVSVGLDIGGTKIAGLIVDESGKTLARDSVLAPTRQGGAELAAAAAGLALRLAGATPILEVGVGAAGVVDQQSGTIRAASATFVDWAGFPLATELAAHLDAPVTIENDVNAFLLSEASNGETDVLGVMLGTGVGGALMIDGELRRGPHGAAGEIGHTSGYGSRICTCGQKGHLETIASGTSIARRYREVTGDGVPNAFGVADRARQGDNDALAVYRSAGRSLAVACASAATLLDFPLAIVGGGVAHAWDLLQPGIAEALETDAPVSGIALEIRPASLGNDAVALGAIEAARRNAQLAPNREGDT